MLRPLITSRANPLVRRLRALHESKGRRAAGEVLLEGTHLLQEVNRLRLAPDQVLFTPAWAQRNEILLHSLPSSVLRQPVQSDVLARMASTENPDGVVCVVPTPSQPWPTQPGFILALDRIQDPGNLGDLLRSALAVGVEGVLLGGGADPWQPKVLRASAGAGLCLPMRRCGEDALAAELSAAGAAGLQRVAAVVGADQQAYWELDWQRPTLLLLGNEGAGIGGGLLPGCDERVCIPHAREVESLNVASAGALLMFERLRPRRPAAV
jgi:TrmH family RNA methyltransferase